jgi:adenine specific DNA methylase Mod
MPVKPASLESTFFTPQTIYCGDCVKILRDFPAIADLIYIDPPFNTSRNYEFFWGDVAEKRAFDDRFGQVADYIKYMRPRVERLYDVLKPNGSFYYHCDSHANAYIRVMLDQIFGPQGFRNEIIWKRSHAHNSAKGCGTNHDTIFFYTKGSDFTWNRVYQKYDEEYLAKHLSPCR